jgi:predicted nucleotidyltransferase
VPVTAGANRGRTSHGPVVEKCRDALQAHYGSRLAGLVLFGSAARGDADSDSDLDLLVLLPEPLDYFEELRTLSEVLYPIQLQSDRLRAAPRRPPRAPPLAPAVAQRPRPHITTCARATTSATSSTRNFGRWALPETT